MRRCMIALDVQPHFKPAQGTVQAINQLSTQFPTAATLFKHNEAIVPLSKLGKRMGPENDQGLIQTTNTFTRHGYLLPQALLDWVATQMPDEVLVAGGHTDAAVLAAGFSLFDAGFRPAIVPLLCYGNDWFMHTVTTGIWNQELGRVYESVAELKFAQ
ncbi:MAG: hydrolase [Alphaproteobacteria bacterium]